MRKVWLCVTVVLALAASGCAYCPGCYVLNQGFKALTGGNLPCHGPSDTKKTSEAPPPEAPRP